MSQPLRVLRLVPVLVLGVALLGIATNLIARATMPSGEIANCSAVRNSFLKAQSFGDRYFAYLDSNEARGIDRLSGRLSDRIEVYETAGWHRDDPIAQSFRLLTDEEREQLGSEDDSTVVIETRNLANPMLPPLLNAMTIGGMSPEEVVGFLGYHIDPLSGLTTYSVRSGPFDGERQLPPELEAELLEKYDLNPSGFERLRRSLSNFWWGYCRVRL